MFAPGHLRPLDGPGGSQYIGGDRAAAAFLALTAAATLAAAAISAEEDLEGVGAGPPLSNFDASSLMDTIVRVRRLFPKIIKEGVSPRRA